VARCQRRWNVPQNPEKSWFRWGVRSSSSIAQTNGRSCVGQASWSSHRGECLHSPGHSATSAMSMASAFMAGDLMMMMTVLRIPASSSPLASSQVISAYVARCTAACLQSARTMPKLAISGLSQNPLENAAGIARPRQLSRALELQ